MDRPGHPMMAPQNKALDFALDALGLLEAPAQVVEDDRVLDLEHEIATLRAENLRPERRTRSCILRSPRSSTRLGGPPAGSAGEPTEIRRPRPAGDAGAA